MFIPVTERATSFRNLELPKRNVFQLKTTFEDISIPA